MASAKDVDIYRMSADKLPSAGSKKEDKQNKVLSAQTNLTNARTFAFNAAEAEKTREFNANEAEKARDWQTEMSNTAHEREVKDLIKAGLNPVLAANTGAQSYTTSAASASNASGKGDSAASAIAAYGSGYLNSQATKYSANQSAAAMRYSANMNYASALAAADATKYAAKMQNMSNMVNGFMDRFHDTWKTTYDWTKKESQYERDRENARRVAEIQNDKTLFGFMSNTKNKVIDYLESGKSITSYPSIANLLGKKAVEGIRNVVNADKGYSMQSQLGKGVMNMLKSANIPQTYNNGWQLLRFIAGKGYPKFHYYKNGRSYSKGKY